ncbi:SGNH/GDSL hydrolase family protein [Pseudomonas sp. 3A(2025)]
MSTNLAYRSVELKHAICLLLLGLSLGTSVARAEAPDAPKRIVTKAWTPLLPANRQDPNLALLANKLKASKTRRINIVQLGDSHTAADLFSGEMRRLFQQDYGNGGIGFIAATPVPGTRYDQVIVTTGKGQWELVSSRNQQSSQFPLGGYLSMPLSSRPSVRLASREPDEQRYSLSTLYQANRSTILQARDTTTQARALPATQGQWRFSQPINTVSLPVDLSFASNSGLAVGGWLLQSQRNAGVQYSALGINGATFDVVDKWQAGWLETLKELRPDLLILAYGTNEAYDDSLDTALYEQRLRERLQMLRKALPGTVLLVTGASDSVRNKRAGRCEDKQANNLRPVIQIQRRVAAQNNALFWDWQAFMGGNCSIERWFARDLARPDLVHLTADGYRQSAQGLYGYLKGVLGRR